MASLLIGTKFSATDSAGQPLSGGFVYTYVAGTLDPQATYTDASGGSPNANPVVLDASGRANIWLDPSLTYRFVVKDAQGVTAPDGDVDNVTAAASAYDLSSTSGSGRVGHGQETTYTAGSLGAVVQSYCVNVQAFPYLCKPDWNGSTGTDNTAGMDLALAHAKALGYGTVFFPAGSGAYKRTTALTVPYGVSLVGSGQGSKIYFAANADGLVFAKDDLSYETQGLSRSIRDLQLIGSDATTSTARGIVVDFTAASGSRVTGVVFTNVSTKDFQIGAYLRGLWNSDFVNCKHLNSFHGWYFYGQNIKTTLEGCYTQRYTMTGTGDSWAFSWQTVSGESTQSTQISKCQSYYYDVGVKHLLGFETQISACDITECQKIGVDITTVNGGFWLRDCWVQTHPLSTPAATTGIKLEALGSANYQDVHIVGNHIYNQGPFTGSIGVSVQAAQSGAEISGNWIGGHNIGIKNIASPNVRMRDNTIDVLSAAYDSTCVAIYVDSLSGDNSISGTSIVKGNTATHSDFYQTCTFTSGSANIVVPDSTKFPVGTPIQFTSTVGGFWIGVQYYVLTSAANVITIGATPSASAFTASVSTTGTLFASPDILQFSSSATPPGLNLIAYGAFHGTLTGFSGVGAPGGPVYWSCSGRVVSLAFEASGVWAATSNATTMTLTGLPAFIAPVRQSNPIALVEDSGVWAYGVGVVKADATVQFFKAQPAVAFTASGTKGLASASPLVYQYN